MAFAIMAYATGSAIQTAVPSVTTSISLAAWRKPDKLGQACSSCHSPDGIELAAYGFSDADIKRRALKHLSEADADRIVAQIHALRLKYRIVKLRDPMNDRPLQPGGSVLSGNSPMERDRAFARSLVSRLPQYFDGRVGSVAQAHIALSQLLKLDLGSLKIGIPLNRLGEDAYHGRNHATIADWFTDVRLVQDLPVKLSNAYLANPSQHTYNKLDAFLASPLERPTSPIQAIGLAKARSLLYLQHRLRMGFLNRPCNVRPIGNPMWELAEQARMDENDDIKSLGLTPEAAAMKSRGPNSAEQFKQLRLPWYWLGWMMDPGLQHSGGRVETKRADYFTAYLNADGPYPMHEAFMIARKLAEEAFVPSEWSEATPTHIDFNFSGLLSSRGLGVTIPTREDHRALLMTFAANSFRTFLLLELDEVSRTLVVYKREAVIQQIHRISHFLKGTKDRLLENRVLKVIGAAREAPDQFVPNTTARPTSGVELNTQR